MGEGVRGYKICRCPALERHAQAEVVHVVHQVADGGHYLLGRLTRLLRHPGNPVQQPEDCAVTLLQNIRGDFRFWRLSAGAPESTNTPPWQPSPAS